MAKSRLSIVMTDTEEYLKKMGEQIKLARLRRNLSVLVICERADISRSTLWQIEKGNPSVAIGSYANVLHAIGGLDKDLLLVAKDDELGRAYQDLNLITKKRINKK